MKCMGDGCEKLIAEGRYPACVSACPVQARMFGDIKDPKSAISERLRTSKTETLLPHKGTKPNFFVVVQK